MRIKAQFFIFVILVGGIFLTPQSAQAVSSNFRELDLDNDNIVSQEEWLANARNEFKAKDRNSDLRISWNEFHGIRSASNNSSSNNSYSNENSGSGYRSSGRRRQPRFETLDINHDGILSQNEWPADKTQYFIALDANADGNVSYNEFFNRKQISATVLNGLDTNNDDRISRGEWTGEAAEFNRVDTNKDNFLTVAELTTASTPATTASATTTASASEDDNSSIEQIFLKLFQS